MPSANFSLRPCLMCEALACRAHALDSRHSTAVVHYMLDILPELHEDSSSSAASLLIHILTSSAAPAQLLHCAMALLNNLPLSEEPSSAPSSSPSGSQLLLACQLLQLFTAEAFQALPKGPQAWPKGKGKAAKGAASPMVAGLEVLLRLGRYGLTQADGQPAEKLRLAAFQRLGAELYAVMPVKQQMEAFLVSLLYCLCVFMPGQLAAEAINQPITSQRRLLTEEGQRRRTADDQTMSAGLVVSCPPPLASFCQQSSLACKVLIWLARF